MEIIKTALLILTVITLCGGIPMLSKEISMFITLSCCTVIILYIVNMAIPAVTYVKEIAQAVHFDNIDIIIKVIGVGFITQFVSDLATDCGNKALANQMIFAGRVCILMIAAPVILEVLKIIGNLTR